MPRKRNSIYGDPFLSDQEMFLQKLAQKADTITGRRSKAGTASDSMPAPKGADAIRNQLARAGIGKSELQDLVRKNALSMDEYNYITRGQGQRELSDLRSKGLLEGAMANGTVDPKKIERLQQYESSGYFGKDVGNNQLTNAGITKEDSGYLDHIFQKKQAAMGARQAGGSGPLLSAPDPYADVTSSAVASKMQQAGIQDPNVGNSGMEAAKQNRMMEVLGKYKGSAPGSVKMDAVKQEAFGPQGQVINGRPVGAKGHDPEVMKDGVSYALMLKNMDPEVIPKVWPRIANDLISRDPTLQGIINPNVPPTPETLNSLLAQAGLGPATGQVARDSKGNVAERQPQGMEIMQAGMNASGAPKKLFELPSGKMLIDPNNPSLGVKPIPGVGMSPEAASKTQMLRTAQSTLPEVKAAVFNPDGSVNRSAIISGSINLPGMNPGIPGTQGRELANVIEYGIQGITRGETGAAMPPSEVVNARVRFQPAAGDSDRIVRRKIRKFEEFIEGSLKLINPDGTFNRQADAEADARIDQELKQEWVQKTMQANPQYANDPEFAKHLSTEYDKKYGGK